MVFDFDGLICDTEWPAYITVAEVFEAHGRAFPLAAWQHRIGRGDNGPWTDLLAEAVGPIDHEAVDEARRARKNELTDAEGPLPGVVEVLATAHEQGLRLAVASSSPSSWVDRHLRRLGLHAMFDAVVTRDHVDRSKPWPDLFQAACRAIDATPRRTVAFEDSVHGVAAAKAAGLYCVAVPNRVTSLGDFSTADVVLDSLSVFDFDATRTQLAMA